MSTMNSPIRNQPRPIPGLGTISHNNRFSVSDGVFWAGDGGAVDAKVVDRVEGEETGVGGLVDGCAGFGDFGGLWGTGEGRFSGFDADDGCRERFDEVKGRAARSVSRLRPSRLALDAHADSEEGGDCQLTSGFVGPFGPVGMI